MNLFIDTANIEEIKTAIKEKGATVLPLKGVNDAVYGE